jgi:hypothetical protein
METMISLIKMAAVVMGGLLLGRMFFAEVKKAKQTGAPWYRPYLTAPGVLTLIALALPIFIWIIGRLR